ncbi:KGG domain-containing protein [Muricomes intestini]|uniref:KGG domain-containing protein n=1 Tax=Muricomes intestini TaxID=1796634 RepID=UPI002FDE6D9F
MANDENLKPIRSKSEAREIGRKGGKASGESRRRKADFRKTLNLLLTAEIDSPEWTPMLEALGLDSTLESAVNGAMIKEALSGNVKAYEAIAKYAGQTAKPDEDLRNREADTKLKQARKQAVTGENETDEALGKLDDILKGVYDNAVKQETE